jgi:8-oxo-dGTP pyrophosphatase MutT (NUDIX family)
MNKNNICNNCGKQGHQFHQCKMPITSYGLVAFRLTTQGIQYLMIRRKDSFGYIDFIRGKYNPMNYDHLKSIFNEMSVDERNNILNTPFHVLWKNMWAINDSHDLSTQYRFEEQNSCKKFESLKVGLPIGENDEIITLQHLVENATTNWLETEWEIPKGRRNYQEKELDCALREFEEETGISKTSIKIIENVLPFEEIFIGSNHKSYKHKYFIGLIEDSNIQKDKYQYSEVSKLEWKNIHECLQCIRPYYLEKQKIMLNINKVLEEYRLY